MAAVLPPDFVGSFTLVGFAFIATVTLTTIISVVRKLFFHPLSDIPGPFLAKITNGYAAYHSYRGDMHLDVQKQHRKYGDMIRYGPNKVLTLHPSDMTAIYSHGKPFRKARGYETMIPIPDGWSTMTSIDKTLHHNLRRIFRLGVSANSLAVYEPRILQNLKIYLHQVSRGKDDQGWSAANDMRAWNLRLGFDTMADFGLGLKTGLLQGTAGAYVFPALHLHEKKMGLWEEMPILNDLGMGSFVSRGLLKFSGKAKLFADWYQSFLDNAITNNTSQSCGIFGPAIQSGQGMLEKPGHNQAQMIAEGAFSTFSSADGYGMMLSGFQHYLCHYPHVYKRLATELRAKYKPGETIAWGPELEACVYLRAIIDEVMRMLPPACGVHWRECEAPGVFLGEDFHVPVGTNVGMSLFTLFRDERIFRDPVKFWPERWLPETLPENEYNLARKMFKPFSIGSRNCAGSHVAIMIASISFTYLIVNFDFRLEPGLDHTSPHANSPKTEKSVEESELRFESHYSIAGWARGPFVQFKERVEEGSLV